jgi:hypothetical protein
MSNSSNHKIIPTFIPQVSHHIQIDTWAGGFALKHLNLLDLIKILIHPFHMINPMFNHLSNKSK